METRPELLTIDETAEFLRVSDKTVRRMLNDGRLKGVNIGRQWRIPKEALAELTRVGGTDRQEIRMDDIVVTTYTNPRGDEYEAIQLPWETVADILGHEHTGNPEDDTTLVRALRDAGAPAWVEDASGWIDEHGWGLIGPATTLEVL